MYVPIVGLIKVHGTGCSAAGDSIAGIWKKNDLVADGGWYGRARMRPENAGMTTRPRDALSGLRGTRPGRFPCDDGGARRARKGHAAFSSHA